MRPLGFKQQANTRDSLKQSGKLVVSGNKDIAERGESAASESNYSSQQERNIRGQQLDEFTSTTVGEADL